MKKEEVEKILDKLIENDFFNSKDISLSEQEIELLRSNPHLLKSLSDGSLIKKRYIYVIFFISISMMVVAKFFQYTKLLNGFEVLDDILTNVLFSVSMEMLGACIVAYMLEVMFERRMRKNKEIIKAIRGTKKQV